MILSSAKASAVKKPLFIDKERGDKVEIPVREGLWGFEYVVPNKKDLHGEEN